jgi:hypothetical protein
MPGDRIMIGRLGVTLLMTLQISAAAAQTYNPAVPVGPPPILPATPPQAVPHMAPIPPLMGQSSQSNYRAPQPSISIGSPAQETSNDRAIRCSGQAAILGLSGGTAGQYTGACVNSP